jgi:hypothetical protein
MYERSDYQLLFSVEKIKVRILEYSKVDSGKQIRFRAIDESWL